MTAIALKLDTAVCPCEKNMPRTVWGTRRSIIQTIELAGVMTLMGTSAAYALFTLSQLV